MIINILKKPSGFRNDAEIKVIELAFEENQYFISTRQKLSEEKMKSLYKNLVHSTKNKGEAVFFMSSNIK